MSAVRRQKQVLFLSKDVLVKLCILGRYQTDHVTMVSILPLVIKLMWFKEHIDVDKKFYNHSEMLEFVERLVHTEHAIGIYGPNNSPKLGVPQCHILCATC